MSAIILKSQNIHRHTLLSNLFIDDHMPKANGDYVKVYVYVLRLVLSGTMDFTLEQIATQMNLIQSDVIRALRYWAHEGLIELSLDLENTITEIGFLSLENLSTTSPVQKNVTEQVPKVKLQDRPTYTPDEMTLYKEQESFKELLYITERYMKKPLAQSDVNLLLGFIDWLGLPIDVVEFLIEFCVSNGHRHMHYIEKVAMDWADHSIGSVGEAKAYTESYNNNYRQIFKSLGINNRTPTPKQITLMDKWVADYNFAIEVIVYACEKTIAAINKPELAYVDAILTNWNNKGVKSLDSIRKSDGNNDKLYYDIFKVLGIDSHKPTKDQRALIDTWFKEYNLSQALVELACRKTIAAINKPDLNYANTILTGWHKNQITTVNEAEKLEATFKNNKSNKKKPGNKNKFINHQQHTYDFDAIEKKMDTLLDQKIDGM